MGKALVFVFHRGLEPVLAVEVHHDAALVEPVAAAGEIGLHGEGEIGLPGLKLQHGGVVIAEVVVGALPQIRAGRGGDLDSVCGNGIISGHSRPLKRLRVKIFHHIQPFCVLLCLSVVEKSIFKAPLEESCQRS